MLSKSKEMITQRIRVNKKGNKNKGKGKGDN
jgi:hypothetical protein